MTDLSQVEGFDLDAGLLEAMRLVAEKILRESRPLDKEDAQLLYDHLWDLYT